MNGWRCLRIRFDRADAVVVTFLSGTTIVARIETPENAIANVAISTALLIAFIRCWL
jgi:hypothetical protein